MTPKTKQLALIAEPEKTNETEALKAWALVELFGHQRVVGMVTVHPPEFPELIRIDVPDLMKNGECVRAGFTRYVGASALYGVTPISEDAVRKLLPSIDGMPAARPLSFHGREDWDS